MKHNGHQLTILVVVDTFLDLFFQKNTPGPPAYPRPNKIKHFQMIPGCRRTSR